MNKREWQAYRKALKELHRHTCAASAILDVLYAQYSNRTGVKGEDGELWDALDALDHTVVRVNNIISEGQEPVLSQSEKTAQRLSDRASGA